MAEALIGREEELVSLTAFLGSLPAGAAAFVLDGEAGVGKTTVWQAGLRVAAQWGCRVLSCRPSGSEAGFSFAALGDLLQVVHAETLPRLPALQRRALELALVLSESDDDPGGEQAVALGFLGVLRSLAETGPVVVAVDDTQWLDRPTATVLEFVARRLGGEPIGLLLTRRSVGEELPPLGLDRALPPERLCRFQLGPLGLEELQELLRRRLQVDLPRPTLRRLRDGSGGNPFFALEIGRALLRLGGGLPPGEALPVPETVRELVRDRLAGLPARTREALLVASALSQPTLALIDGALGRGANAATSLGEALEADVVELDLDRVRFTHPLLASTLYSEAPVVARRRLHRGLAAVVLDPEETARHLALAAEGPDAAVALALDRAAARARARGAPEAAALHAEHACRLTPDGHTADLWRRTIHSAEYHYEAGDALRARQLVEEAVLLAPTSRDRAEALDNLGRYNLYHDIALADQLFQEALGEAGIDLPTRAASEHGLAIAGFMGGADFPAAAVHARAAVESAAGVDAVTLGRALMVQAWIGGVRGEPSAVALMERGLELEGDKWHWHVLNQASHHMASFLAWADRLEEFRSSLEQLYEQAVGQGDESSIPILLDERSWAELMLGNWVEARRLAAAAAERSPDERPGVWATMLIARLYALVGDVGPAREWAERALALAEEIGANRMWINVLGTFGFLELSLGHPAEAHHWLARSIAGAEAAGIHAPGEFEAIADDVEALLALGRVDEAAALLAPLEERARVFDHPSARGACARCRGLILAAHSDLPAARRALDEAIEQHERGSRPFELARSVLVLGVIQRRAKQKAVARETLQRALATFDRVGARLWAEKAQTELGRIGGRAPSRWELTPTEEQVAALVVAGHTNREVAAKLFMSVRTVDWNLRKIYGKLGIHSRRELAARAHRPTGS